MLPSPKDLPSLGSFDVHLEISFLRIPRTAWKRREKVTGKATDRYRLCQPLGFLVVAGCGKDEHKPVNIAVSVNDTQTQNSEPKLTPQQIYDAAIAKAFCLLGEKKEAERSRRSRKRMAPSPRISQRGDRAA